jgi:Ca2+-binding RTX toxin-like protein
VFRTNGIVRQLKTNLYAVTGQEQQLADGNAVVFGGQYNDAIDNNDVLKASNVAENFSISREGSLLAIDARKNLSADDVVYFKISNLKQQDYKLHFSAKNLDASLTAYLEDRFLYTFSPVSLTNTTEVNFTVTSDPASSATDRFRLVFKRKGAEMPIVSEKTT